MTTLLLLLLSLMTCAEILPSTVKGCLGGWVEFSFKYPYTNIDYAGGEDETHSPIRISKKNEWESRDRLSLYSDPDNNNVKVFIKQLRQRDIGEWWCIFGKQKSIIMKLELESGKVCQQSSDQKANEYDKTTFTCEYPKVQYKDVFFCKESSHTCEDVPSGTSLQSDQKFSKTKTNNGFSVSISSVSTKHEGVYWCGLKPKTGDYRFGFRKIELKVKEITNFQKSAQVGGALNYFCRSHDNIPEIFICKGEDPSLCQRLISTTGQETSDGRFFIRKDGSDYFDITLRDVQYNDSGMYWCGAKSTDKTTSDRFLHRMTLSVYPAPFTPAPTEGDGERDSESSEDEDHQWMYILGIIGSVLLLLLLVLVSFLIYKCLPQTRSKRNEATTSNIREDYVYEEIQERAQNPDSNAVAKTIYATLDHPTNSSAALHYASISFQQSPNSARAEGLVLKPTYSTCEYSSVKTSQSPAGGVCSGPSGEPLYSTVNKKL